jgi:hypothetical protein
MLTPTTTETPPFHVRALAALEAAMTALRGGHAAEIDTLRATHAGEVRDLRSRLADAEARAERAAAEARDAHERAEALAAADEARKPIRCSGRPGSISMR